jgi:GGDEF domain-containing protein
MLEWSHDGPNGGQDPHGGIVSLLRVMKVQCRSALACLALRDPAGRLTLASFPLGASVPPWSHERIEQALEEVWEDPSLRAGAIMLRISQQTTGSPRPLRIAAAPLRWAEQDGESWGLLCLLDPLSGDFDQEQCDLLAGFASRVVAYYQARDEVLHELPDERSQTPTATLTPPRAAEPVRMLEDSPQADPVAEAAAKKDKKDKRLKLKSKDKGRERDKNGNGDKKASSEPNKPKKSKIEDLTATGFIYELDHDGYPSQAETERISQVTLRLLERQTWPPFAEDLESGAAMPEEAAEPVVRPLPEPRVEGRDLLASLESDPITGLGGLPALLGELGSALNAPRSSSSCVVLTLLELRTTDAEAEPSDELALEIARALRSHVRGDDIVFRLEPRVFAVTTTLHSKAIFPSNIEERLNQALRFALASARSSFELCSAYAYATGSATIPRPEAFFQEAVTELRSSPGS